MRFTTIDISVGMLWWGRSVIWCVCHTGSMHIILLSVYMLLPDPLHLTFLWGCLDWLRLWCFNEMGVRINQDQGQGCLWGMEEYHTWRNQVLYPSVNWCVCQNQDCRSTIENGSTSHILLGGLHGGLRLSVYTLLWDSLYNWHFSEYALMRQKCYLVRVSYREHTHYWEQ